MKSAFQNKYPENENCFLQEKQSFLVLGPNLTLQHIHKTASLKPGEVNRMEQSFTVASGKGVNVSRALKKLGADVLLAGFIGGFNGQRLKFLLEEEGIALLDFPMKSESRNAITILEERSCTEIIEASPTLFAGEMEFALDSLMKEIENRKFTHIIVTGTTPGTRELSLTRSFLERIRDTGLPVFLDLCEPWLKDFELPKQSFLKINWKELCTIENLPMPENPEEKKRMISSLKIPGLLITDEEKDAVMKFMGELIVLPPPSLDRIVNPIGAGDVCCASLAFFLYRTPVLKEVLAKSLELASRSCLHPVPGDW